MIDITRIDEIDEMRARALREASGLGPWEQCNQAQREIYLGQARTVRYADEAAGLPAAATRNRGRIMTRDELIEAEGKRRCINAGLGLDHLCCQDRRFRHDNMTPYWQHLAREVKSEIERIEAMGFTVQPSADAAAS